MDAPGTVRKVSLTAVRDDLAAALEETLRLARRLAEDARDTEVPVAELVAQATMLGRLDQRREELIGELRRTASAGMRAASQGRRSGRSSWPPSTSSAGRRTRGSSRSTCGPSTSCSWTAARSPRCAVTSCGRGSAHPASRSAYVVPALNPDGSANPRWLTSSAWDLPRRVIASAATERLFDLQKIQRVARPRLAGPARHAARALRGADPGHRAAAGVRVATATRAWRTHVRSHTAALIEAIRSTTTPTAAGSPPGWPACPTATASGAGKPRSAGSPKSPGSPITGLA
jgi:hypothetical protein